LEKSAVDKEVDMLCFDIENELVSNGSKWAATHQGGNCTSLA